MIPKLLAWSALATAILFAILAATAIFAFGREGAVAPTARMIGWFGVVPLLGISMLLALAVLVAAAFTSEGE
jgi:ABC-type transport system involved in multi-copper enzyme maturation permease subunit